MQIRSILVICTGNICRSPMGEGLLQLQVPELSICSAGTNGLTGQGAHAQALEVAAAHGISLGSHVARTVTAPMLKQHDLILAMEQGQINRLSQIAPEVRGKVMLFGKWLGGQEIPDPYGQSRDAFEYVFRLLGEASQEWASRLTVKGLQTCRQKH